MSQGERLIYIRDACYFGAAMCSFYLPMAQPYWYIPVLVAMTLLIVAVGVSVGIRKHKPPAPQWSRTLKVTIGPMMAALLILGIWEVKAAPNFSRLNIIAMVIVGMAFWAAMVTWTHRLEYKQPVRH